MMRGTTSENDGGTNGTKNRIQGEKGAISCLTLFDSNAKVCDLIGLTNNQLINSFISYSV